MNVLICGSRNWERYDLIHAKLAELPRDATIIHGNARGADVMAGLIAESLGLDVEVRPAYWEHHGRKAGVRRTALIFRDDKPDLVIAFHRDGSVGTQHTIDMALKRGVPLDVVSA